MTSVTNLIAKWVSYFYVTPVVDVIREQKTPVTQGGVVTWRTWGNEERSTTSVFGVREGSSSVYVTTLTGPRYTGRVLIRHFPSSDVWVFSPSQRGLFLLIRPRLIIQTWAQVYPFIRSGSYKWPVKVSPVLQGSTDDEGGCQKLYNSYFIYDFWSLVKQNILGISLTLKHTPSHLFLDSCYISFFFFTMFE